MHSVARKWSLSLKRKYGKDSIMEAICEFYFDPQSDWDFAVPGLMYGEIEDAFPDKRTAKAITQSTSSRPEGQQHNIQITERNQFFSPDGNAAIQISPHYLSVNHINRYPTWSKYRPMIEKGLFCKAVPDTVQRIVLRYINKIDIPGPNIELPHYFNLSMVASDALPRVYSSFIVGIRSKVEDPAGELKIQLTNVPGTEDQMSVLLDIEHSFENFGNISKEDALNWIDSAHLYVVNTFECTITDATRKLFGDPNE